MSVTQPSSGALPNQAQPAGIVVADQSTRTRRSSGAWTHSTGR